MGYYKVVSSDEKVLYSGTKDSCEAFIFGMEECMPSDIIRDSLTVTDERPSVDLYGDGIGVVQYVNHMGTDISIVNSARVSFGKHKEKIDARDQKLIKYLIRNKHTSTLEHCSITYRVVVPLFVRSQHHRHRTWSYNEISRRYTDIDIRFYEPERFRTQHKSNRQASNPEDLVNPEVTYENTIGTLKGSASEMIAEHHRESLVLFNSLIDAGVCREQARGVLPQNMYTQYYATTNLNNLLKFVDLRIHSGAQWEIQQVAKAFLEIATDLFPITINSYREIKNERL